jgi:hypothetical protein
MRNSNKLRLARRGIVSMLATIAMATGQSPIAAKKWTTPRTPDGQPDLEGIWTNATITALERPKELARKEFFTHAMVRHIVQCARGGMGHAASVHLRQRRPQYSSRAASYEARLLDLQRGTGCRTLPGAVPGEFFNAFNHPQFDLPNATIGSAAAGVISSTVRPGIFSLACG